MAAPPTDTATPTPDCKGAPTMTKAQEIQALKAYAEQLPADT